MRHSPDPPPFKQTPGGRARRIARCAFVPHIRRHPHQPRRSISFSAIDTQHSYRRLRSPVAKRAAQQRYFTSDWGSTRTYGVHKVLTGESNY
eukprot:6186643-Pyramimonas_sp.AAC.1